MINFEFMLTFKEKLERCQKLSNSFLSVGLDPDLDLIPLKFRKSKTPLFDFNKYIIDETNEYVCAYKPNSAFYEAYLDKGIEQLKITTDYLQKNFPDIPIIIDAKRGDIGNTNKGYVKFALSEEGLNSDAVTLHPYLGGETLQPFLELKAKGFFILCRTSNPESGEFQNLTLKNGKKLYQEVANKVVKVWNKNGNCMLVVGATYPKEIAQVRKIAKDIIFLIPGVGAQGGDLEKTVKAGRDPEGKGIIINSTREVIYNDSPGLKANEIRERINLYNL